MDRRLWKTDIFQKINEIKGWERDFGNVMQYQQTHDCIVRVSGMEIHITNLPPAEGVNLYIFGGKLGNRIYGGHGE